MTTWADICAAAMVYIDDIRLAEQMSISPALYYRRMSLFVSRALPKLCKPPELLAYLRSELSEPSYGDYYWVSTAESTTQETVVETGLTEFGLCSCVINEQLDDGRIIQTPYAVDYDAETGNVTFPIQAAEGINYQLDFYTDGSVADLSDKQLDLFALAVAYVWDERFERTWLSITPKIHDSSFETVNEANYIEKDSQRLLRNYQRFFDALRNYEQNCAYFTTVNTQVYKIKLI